MDDDDETLPNFTFAHAHITKLKQEEKILNDPAAMYRFYDLIIMILSGLVGGL